MGKNRHLKVLSKEEILKSFTTTVDFISETIGNKAFRPKGIINASIFDSVMVGIWERLKKGEIKNKSGFVTLYENLLSNEEYTIATTEGTSDEPVVAKRLTMAIKQFEKII